MNEKTKKQPAQWLVDVISSMEQLGALSGLDAAHWRAVVLASPNGRARAQYTINGVLDRLSVAMKQRDRLRDAVGRFLQSDGGCRPGAIKTELTEAWLMADPPTDEPTASEPFTGQKVVDMDAWIAEQQAAGVAVIVITTEGKS